MLRRRIARLDGSLLFGESAPPTLTLNLFDNIALAADRLRVEVRSESSWTWIGTVTGDDDLPNVLRQGSAIIVSEAGAIAGNIAVNGKLYQFRSVAGGLLSVSEVDQSAFPAEGHPRTPPQTLDSTQVVRPLEAADSSSDIGVMVLHTQAAMLGAGGQTAIESQVQLGIDETNQAYQSTGVTQRVRLVYRGMVNYVDSGDLETDLTRLAFSGDGFLDQVHALRNFYRADIVSLWVENPGDLCGLGYLMSSPSLSAAPSAFNVVGRQCATGYYTFAHEMGHNMGAAHDRLNAESPGLYSFSYGYQEPVGVFRTIMAYDCPAGCPRIQAFSSPNYPYLSRPIGAADADNSRS